MSLMLTEPKAFTSGNYALESGGRFYRQRTGKVRAIVMHVTAGLQDLGMEGTDESAEGTNRWALNSGAQVSWHRIADSDGVERCLPSWATAWHAEGYNSNTVGEEISNVDARWDNKPADWVTWTLWWAAVGVADWVVTYKVPLRRATQAELDRAIATDGAPVGFIDHSRLSTNRRDPGATFPWDRFFTYVAAVINGATSPEEDDMQLNEQIPLSDAEKRTWGIESLTVADALKAALVGRKYGYTAVARLEAIEAALAQKGVLSAEDVDRISAGIADKLDDEFEVQGDVRLAPKAVQS